MIDGRGGSRGGAAFRPPPWKQAGEAPPFNRELLPACTPPAKPPCRQREMRGDPQECRASDSPACTSSASSGPHWIAGQKPTPSSLGPHPQVPPIEAPQPFEHVISLGSSCAISLFLRQQRLRVHAGPFDWIFSSARMVAACLDDDFACFLDPAQYAPMPQQLRLQPMCHGCIIASPGCVSKYPGTSSCRTTRWGTGSIAK